MNAKKNERHLTTLVPDPKEGVAVPRYKVSLPDRIDIAYEHFPEGFPVDAPAMVTDAFARDVLALSEKTDGTFHIHIDLPDFLNVKYPWMPFTLALHALILAPHCNVFFRGMDPVKYSETLDEMRPCNPLECIRNFVTYLFTTKGDRPGRVFEQVPSGSFVSFGWRIMDLYRTGFAPYYLSWLRHPYKVAATDRVPAIYQTHPFDHLPVRNLIWGDVGNFLTKSQMKTAGVTDPDIEDAVLMHDQIGTVRLVPYWRAR